MMVLSPQTTAQVENALLPITPKADSWVSDEVLDRVIQHFYDGKEHGIQLQSHYDRENFEYAMKLLEKNLEPAVVGREIKERTQRHETYFDGDRNFQGILENVVQLYNALADRLGKSRLEFYFGSGINNENVDYVKHLVASNFDKKVVKEEIRARIRKDFHSNGNYLSIRCEDIIKSVTGIYNAFSGEKMGEGCVGDCSPCKYQGIWCG